MDIESHVGYRGGLSVEGCDTAAYYADSHIEIILHCPYLLKVDYVEKSLVVAELRPVSTLPPQIDMIPPLSPSMEDSTMLMTTPHDFGGLSEPNSLKKEGGILLSGRSSSVDTEKKPVQAQDVNDTSGTSNTTANKSHHSNSATHTHKSFANTVSEDLVHVIWIENLDQIHVLAKKILAFFHPKSHHYNQPAPQQQQPQPLRPTSPPAVSNSSGPYVFIFVHPLPHTPSLYLIRLLMIGGEHQAHDMLPFGPLSDGVIISRHSLVLIKNTAVAALYYLKGLRSSNKKPYEKRMHHLEEICNRHKQKNLSLAGFYSLLFAK